MIPPKILLASLFAAALQPAGASSPAARRADLVVAPPGHAQPAEAAIPVPEPTSAVLGLIATAVILLRRRPA